MQKKRKETIVLVTGSGGMVGSYVDRVFKSKNYSLILADKKYLDVTDRTAVLRKVRKHKPDLVIHLAAQTNVDFCEKNPKEAYKTNTDGTKNIVDASKKIDATVIYISTSAVFNGEKKGFSEKDSENPVNVYGNSKFAAEKYVKEKLSKYYIIRAGWMIGGGKKEKKFISYIIDQANKNMNMKVVNDKFGTITYAYELIEFLKTLYEKRSPYGIYHYGSSGICSRYDIAVKVLDIIGKNLKVAPVSSKSFESTFFAPRPKYEVIKSIKRKFPNTWRKSLKNYITNEII